MHTTAIRVVVIEDDDRTRSLIASTIDEEWDMACAAAYDGVEDALASADQASIHADIILLDITLAGMSGLDGIRALRRAWPRAEIVMLTASIDEDLIFDAVRRGATGYILKGTSPSRITYSLREAHAGGASMTSSIARLVQRYFRQQATALGTLAGREQDVLDRIVEGKTNRQIARELHLSENAIAFEIKRIYQKLELLSRAEAVANVGRKRN